jgi:Amt family ammonium transporter
VLTLLGLTCGVSCCASCRTSQFFYEGETLVDKAVRPWFFSWTFCIAACTIISGCLAERTALAAYPVATLVIAALVHPLLVHWIWNPQVG